MADNFRVVGDDDIEFGTEGVGYAGIGVIVSASRKDGGDKLEIKNRKGNVFVVIYFNDKKECEIKVIFEDGVTLPVRGDAIDVCGVVDVLVDDVENNWESEGARMLTIRGTRYEALAA